MKTRSPLVAVVALTLFAIPCVALASDPDDPPIVETPDELPQACQDAKNAVKQAESNALASAYVVSMVCTAKTMTSARCTRAMAQYAADYSMLCVAASMADVACNSGKQNRQAFGCG